jgi:hypothetical protein
VPELFDQEECRSTITRMLSNDPALLDDLGVDEVRQPTN